MLRGERLCLLACDSGFNVFLRETGLRRDGFYNKYLTALTAVYCIIKFQLGVSVMCMSHRDKLRKASCTALLPPSLTPGSRTSLRLVRL
ncbi:hypothetical protein J6590_018669 [Homalodisca vitripennis]|nr:hypothetical protein J6590_018669 [Homalodisca vitripennis]